MTLVILDKERQRSDPGYAFFLKDSAN